MVERGGLENRWPSQGARGFESHPLRSAPRREELAQQRGALLLEHAAGHLGAVVEGGLGEDVEDAAGGAGLGVGGADRRRVGMRARTIAPAHIAQGSRVT